MTVSTISWTDRAKAIKERIDLIDYIFNNYPYLTENHKDSSNKKRRISILCPFHKDVNPSMIVDSKRFYCFRCGQSAAGDLIDFVSKIEKLNFKKTIVYLENKLGISPEKKEISIFEITRHRIKRAIDKLEIQSAKEQKIATIQAIMKLSETNPSFFEKIFLEATKNHRRKFEKHL